MFAIIETGGKQYKVNEGDVIFVEKLETEAGETVTFDKVLSVIAQGDVKVGAPYVDGAIVTASVIKQGKGKKMTILRYKPKKNQKRKMGHRQPYTRLQITKISI